MKCHRKITQMLLRMVFYNYIGNIHLFGAETQEKMSAETLDSGGWYMKMNHGVLCWMVNALK